MDPITLSAFNEFAALANVNDSDRVVLANGGIGVANLRGLAVDVEALSPSEIAAQNAAVRQALYESVGRFVDRNTAFDTNGEAVAKLRNLIGTTEDDRAKDLTAKEIRDIIRAMRTTDVAFDENVRTAEALERTDRGGFERFFALVERSGKTGEEIAALLGKAGDDEFVTVFERLRSVPGPVNGLSAGEIDALTKTLGDMSELALAKISKPSAALSEADLDFLEALQTASFKMALELGAIAESGKEVEAADLSFTRRVMAFNTAFARIEAEAAAGAKDMAAFRKTVARLSDELKALRNVDENASFAFVEENPVAREITDRIDLIAERLAEFQDILSKDPDNACLAELVKHRRNDFVGMLMAGEISPRQYLELRGQGYTAEMILKGAELGNVGDDLGQGMFSTVVKQEASGDAVHTSRVFAVKDETRVAPGCAAAFLGLPDMSGAKLNFAASRLAKAVGSGNAIAESGIVLDGGTVKICMEVVKGKSIEDFLNRLERQTSQIYRLFHPNPADAKAVARAEKLRLQLVVGLNRLVWADAFSGEVDRHLGNVMVHINLENETVDVVGIDNEQGFAPNCTGLSKAVYSRRHMESILARFLKNKAKFDRYVTDVLHEEPVGERAFRKLFAKNSDGTYSPKYSRKLTAAENYVLSQSCGINSSRTPAFIMKDQLDRLLTLEKLIAAWRKGDAKDNLAAHPLVRELFPILTTGRRRNDVALFMALVSRADSLIAHAKKLKDDGLVIYGDAAHKAEDLAVMKRIAAGNKARNDIDCFQSLDLAEILLKRLV